MPKNSITSRPPRTLESAPVAPLRTAAGIAHSTSPAAAAIELRLSRFSQSERVGPDVPTGPLPEAGPDSALEVMRSNRRHHMADHQEAGGGVAAWAAPKFYTR